uniref:NAD(P)-binding protein n=1 Tax=Elaeophora elaphi TaxID=1147741 RepID=A0A0R3RP78_9BILA
LDDYKEVWDVNIYGVIRVTQAFRDLIKKSRGRIVICTSATTLCPVPSHGPYASSKCAVHAYCIVIRHELQPYGVDVIEIVPGCFKTGMMNLQKYNKLIDTLWYRASQEIHDQYGHDYIEKAKVYADNMHSLILTDDKRWVIDAYYEA